MAIRREKLQLFSMSFLDVISCGFGAVLLVFLLVSSQAQRNALAAMEERTVAFTLHMRAEDNNGQQSPFIPEGRVFLVHAPKPNLRIGEKYPPQWIRSPSGDLSALCLESSVTPPGSTLYGVLRGVKPNRFVFRVVLRSPPPSGTKLFVRGWVTDPTRGYQDLSEMLLPTSKGVVNVVNSELVITESAVLEFDGIVAE